MDQQGLVLFAAVTWDDIVQCGFTAAPGGDSEAYRSVFAFHYYEAPQKDQVTYFNTRYDDAARLAVGTMLTEFERPQNNNSTDPEVDPFERTAEAADHQLTSWTMWEYKTFCKETNRTLNSDSQAAAFG